MNSKCDQKITSFDDVTRDIQHGTCVPTIHVSSEKQAENTTSQKQSHSQTTHHFNKTIKNNKTTNEQEAKNL